MTSGHSYELRVLPDTLAICRLAAQAPVPGWAAGPGLVGVTRTADELSIVCPQDRVPPGTVCEPGWRCLQVAGPLAFSMSGVLASLSAPLAEARISIFAVSTYDTDYLLLRQNDLERARQTLTAAGHRVG